MTTTTDYPFSPGELAGLRSACAAVVALPGEDCYEEEVATWNLAVQLRPALVVGARTADDVVHAVWWAAGLGLAVGVNATGHGAVPNAAGALLINTQRLAQVTVDPVSATATVGAGARMGNVTAAAARYGLTPIQGSSGSAGAAGFTLGGGLGVLSRTFGLALDRVLSIDVVTSDGRLRTVDADRHPELFWAQGWDLDNVFRVGHALLPAPAETPGDPRLGLTWAGREPARSPDSVRAIACYQLPPLRPHEERTMNDTATDA